MSRLGAHAAELFLAPAGSSSWSAPAQEMVVRRKCARAVVLGRRRECALLAAAFAFPMLLQALASALLTGCER